MYSCDFSFFFFFFFSKRRTPTKSLSVLVGSEMCIETGVRWFLSIDINDVPASAREQGQRTFRSITVNGQEIEFSGGFTDLHTRSYQEILAGRGFGLEENRVAIDTVATIRSAKIKGGAERHPYLSKIRK